jgi:3-hydroxyisobutyrate dehydrogenase-like beta-hydroxyacid dehydrogenase
LRAIFSGDDNLHRERDRKVVHQLRNRFARSARRGGAGSPLPLARQSLEACMASSITQAREGSLYLMCGGSEDAFRPRGADPEET